MIQWHNAAAFTACRSLNWPLVHRRLRLLGSLPNVHQSTADCFPIAAHRHRAQFSSMMSWWSHIRVFKKNLVVLLWKAYLSLGWFQRTTPHNVIMPDYLLSLWLWFILSCLHSLPRPFQCIVLQVPPRWWSVLFTFSAWSHCSGSPRHGVGRVDRRQWKEKPNTWYTRLTKSKQATISSSSCREREGERNGKRERGTEHNSDTRCKQKD